VTLTIAIIFNLKNEEFLLRIDFIIYFYLNCNGSEFLLNIIIYFIKIIFHNVLNIVVSHLTFFPFLACLIFDIAIFLRRHGFGKMAILQ